MANEGGDIVDQAIGWHLRQAELSVGEWRDFTAWLEADAAHAEAFDRIALDDRLLSQITFPAEARAQVARRSVVEAPRRRRWPLAIGGSAMAAAIVALLVPLALPVAADPYSVTTKPGQRQDLKLADGTRIEMSGGTTLRLDRHDPRVASLETGEATFHVRHDDAHPYTLRSGDLTVRDLGTIFNVARTGPRLDVQVAEGSVLLQPAREAITLKAGNAVSIREDLHLITRLQVSPETVGGWRNGQVAFTGETLATVFASVERLDGAQITLTAGLSARPFTGMVRLTGVAEQDIPHLAVLIGAGWRRDGERWILSPAESKTP